MHDICAVQKRPLHGIILYTCNSAMRVRTGLSLCTCNTTFSFSGNDVINTFPDARDPETQNVMRFYSPSRRVLEFIEKVKSELEKAKTGLQGGASPVRIGHLALILQSLDVEVMFFLC